MNTQIPSEKPLLEWEAAQHHKHEHSRRWYVCAALVLGVCIAYGVWTEAWSFLAVLLIVSILYIYTHRIEPGLHTMRIWQKGFAIDEDFIPWENCKGFWIDERIHPLRITFEVKRLMEPFVKIQLGEVSKQELEELLTPLTTEIEHKKKNIVDILIHFSKL